ncbi:hypothetical protein LINPERHAP2_LOCUS4369 [Linum perenne]
MPVKVLGPPLVFKGSSMVYTYQNKDYAGR